MGQSKGQVLINRGSRTPNYVYEYEMEAVNNLLGDIDPSGVYHGGTGEMDLEEDTISRCRATEEGLPSSNPRLLTPNQGLSTPQPGCMARFLKWPPGEPPIEGSPKGF